MLRANPRWFPGMRMMLDRMPRLFSAAPRVYVYTHGRSISINWVGFRFLRRCLLRRVRAYRCHDGRPAAWIRSVISIATEFINRSLTVDSF